MTPDPIESFLAVLYRTGLNAASKIIAELGKDGIECSLDDQICLDCFATEWLFARLIWFERRANGFEDVNLRQVVSARLASELEELAKKIPNGQEGLEEYRLFLNEPISVKASIGHGPGWGLVHRYESLLQIATEGKRKPNGAEILTIAFYGDSELWTDNGNLEATFASWLK